MIEARNATFTVYRYVVRTGPDGSFSIPAADRNTVFSQGAANSGSKHWIVAAIKPGYVVGCDEPCVVVAAKPNLPRAYFPSLQTTPPYSKNGSSVLISPIVLRAEDLSINEAVNYYIAFQSFGTQRFDLSPDQDKTLQKTLGDYYDSSVNTMATCGCGGRTG